jgi:hypothetical protein
MPAPVSSPQFSALSSASSDSPPVKVLRLAPLLTLHTPLELEYDAASDSVSIRAGPDFVMKLAAADDASQSVDYSNPALARRSLSLPSNPLLPRSWRVGAAFRAIFVSRYYAVVLSVYGVFLVLNGALQWTSTAEWSVALVVLPALSICAIELSQMHRTLLRAVFGHFDVYYLCYQLLLYAGASVWGAPNSDGVFAAIVLVSFAIIILCFDAQPAHMHHRHFRILVLTLFVLNSLRILVADLTGILPLDARPVCVLVCTDTRRLALDALWQVTLFALRNLWVAIRTANTLSFLKLPILQYID